MQILRNTGSGNLVMEYRISKIVELWYAVPLLHFLDKNGSKIYGMQ